MITTYDLTAFEEGGEYDVNNNFYIVEIAKGSFKFCAASFNLDLPRTASIDSGVSQYWPIGRDQFNNENLATVFLNNIDGVLSSKPYTLDELNTSLFNNYSAFAPDSTPQRTFAIPISQDTTYWEQYIDYAPEEPDSYGAPHPGLKSTRRFDELPDDLMRHAQRIGFFTPENACSIKFLLQVDVCAAALRRNIILFYDFKGMDSTKIRLLAQSVLVNQSVIDAIAQRVFTIEHFRYIDNRVIPKVGFAISSNENCMNALREGRTTINDLAKLAQRDAQAFWEAVRTNNYPSLNLASDCNIM